MRAPALVSLSLPVLLMACGKEPRHPPEPTQRPIEKPAPAQAPPPARGPEHAVWSFADNRLLLHVERNGGLAAYPGWAGFAKYMRFARPTPNKLSWKHHQKKDGRWVGIAEPYAQLAVPLTDV